VRRTSLQTQNPNVRQNTQPGRKQPETCGQQNTPNTVALMLISNFSTPDTKDRLKEKEYIFSISLECQAQKYEPKNNELRIKTASIN
jgi:hypothetical protein